MADIETVLISEVSKESRVKTKRITGYADEFNKQIQPKKDGNCVPAILTSQFRSFHEVIEVAIILRYNVTY